MIEAENLTKIYGNTSVLRDVTFRVEPGQILGFLGPNGAGKTTTMRILTGYLPATEGTARVAGFDVHGDSIAVRKQIGYLPETPPLYPEMTVEGFLHFVARIKGVPSGDRRDRVQWAIQRCSIGEKQGLPIRKLSKGFRQRVGIAQAIVHNPPVIVLDEPTVGLDPRQIIEVRNLIKSLAGDHTIILSTHILPEVSMTCDRVAIINRGSLVATDTLENLTGVLGNQWRYTLEIAHGETPFLTEFVDGNEGEVPPEEVAPEINEAEVSDGEVDEESAGPRPSWMLTDFAQQWCDRLATLPGVSTVDPDLAATAADPSALNPNHLRLQIHTEPGEEPGQAIAALVIREGLGLCEMRRDRPSLEEAFLRLTTSG